MEAGADDLVIKPLDPAALERKLIAAERMTGLHRRMHGDARQDPLTGVGNRLRLAEDVKALCGRVERYGHSYCVALFDIDNFKAFNDGVGHLAGDDVLRAVAGALRRRDPQRRHAVPLRRRGVPRAARRAVAGAGGASRASGCGPPSRRWTCAIRTAAASPSSAGVAGLGTASCSPDQLFALADEALYRAKQAGRNRVEIARAARPGARRAGRAAADRRRRRGDPAHAERARRAPRGARAGRRGRRRRGGDRARPRAAARTSCCST